MRMHDAAAPPGSTSADRCFKPKRIDFCCQSGFPVARAISDVLPVRRRFHDVVSSPMSRDALRRARLRDPLRGLRDRFVHSRWRHLSRRKFARPDAARRGRRSAVAPSNRNGATTSIRSWNTRRMVRHAGPARRPRRSADRGGAGSNGRLRHHVDQSLQGDPCRHSALRPDRDVMIAEDELRSRPISTSSKAR